MIPVLFYHRVGPFREGAPRRMTVLPENFVRQMEWIRRSRYEPVSLDAVVAGTAPKRSVAVTFDDGYADLLEHALPVLRRLRIPATFFIVTGAAGATDTWYRSEERILDWDAVRALRQEGFDIGSHSATHRRLDRLSKDEAWKEILGSRETIEKQIGIAPRHFAYPQGGADSEAVRRVREAGYAAGWGTKGGWDPEFVRRRLPVSATMGRFRFALRLFKARLGYYG